MNDLSKIDHEQFCQLLEQGHTPEEAAKILLESRRSIAEVCERLLAEPTDTLQRMLEELDAQEPTHENKG